MHLFFIIWLFTMITLLSLSPGSITALLLFQILCVSLKVLSLVWYTFWDNKSVVCRRNSWNSSFCSGVKHLPNNIRNILWKFELEMFCWTLDICRSDFSTFSVPRPYYHGEVEYFFTSYGSIWLYFNKLAKKRLLRSMHFEK